METHHTVEVLNTIEIGDHPDEIIYANIDGLPTETVTSSQGSDQFVNVFEVQSSEDSESLLTQRFYLAQGETGSEIFIVGLASDQDNPNEQTVAHFVQSSSVNSTIPIECATTDIVVDDGDVIESSVDSESITCVVEAPHEYQSILIPEEGVNEVTVNSNSVEWTYAEEGSAEKDDEGPTEVLFIPNQKLDSDTILATVDKDHQKILQLAPSSPKFDPVQDNSSEPGHESVFAESIESVSTDQQDENVSSSCTFNAKNIALGDISVGHVNQITVVDEDLSNKGLDLSMNKTVQGVSVIHVTSSSDFTIADESEVVDNVHSKIVEVETDVYPVENFDNSNNDNSSFDNSSVPCTPVLDDESYMSEEIVENSELNDGQTLSENEKYQFSEEPSLADQTVPVGNFICVKNVGDDVAKCGEAVRNEASASSRSSSVLVYSRKENPKIQRIKGPGQSTVYNDLPVAVDERTEANNDNVIIEIVNQNLNDDDSGAHNENLKNPSSDETAECEVSNTSLAQETETSGFVKEIEKPCSDDIQQESDFNKKEFEEVDKQLIVEQEHVPSPLPLLPTESIDKSSENQKRISKSNVTVIKSLRKTLGTRRSRHYNKSTEASETTKSTIQNLDHPSNEEIVNAESCPETSNSVPISSEQSVDQPPEVTTKISELPSDNVADTSELHVIEQLPEESSGQHDTANTEINGLPQAPILETVESLNGSNSSSLKEAILQPPKKTYLRKRKQMHPEPVVTNDNSAGLDGDIELFSCADLDYVCNKEDSVIKPENNSTIVSDTNIKVPSSEDDSLLFSSDIRNKGSMTYKRRKTSGTHNIPDFLKSIRKRNLVAEDRSKQNSDAVTTSDIASATLNIASATSDIASATSDIASDVASAASDVASAASDIASAASDVASAASDVVTAASDVVTATSDVVTATSDAVTASLDVAIAPSDVVTAPPDVATAPSDVAIPVENPRDVPEAEISSELKNESSSTTPKRSRRLITKKRKHVEDGIPVAKLGLLTIPTTVTNPVDIENDLNQITTAPVPKKAKSKSSPSFVVPETAFYPNVSDNFLQTEKNKLKQKKRGSLGKISEKNSSSSKVILAHSNGSLTRHQLNNRLNEYNFSDSENSEDNLDSKGYSSESFNRRKKVKPYVSKSKSSTSSSTWDKFVKSSPDKIRKSKFLPKIKRKAARLSSHDPSKDIDNSQNSDNKKVHFSPHSQNGGESASSSRVEFSPVDEDDGFYQFRIQSPWPETVEPLFQCLNCEFETKRVNNYIYHLRECLNSLRVNEEEITDMDRRQQIRGNQASSSQCFPSSSRERRDGGHNSLIEDENMDEVDNDDDLQKDGEEGFEFRKNDIVWVEVKRIYWPSLVIQVYPSQNKATVYFIDCPIVKTKKKWMTVDVSYLKSYNNAETNKNYLDAGRMKLFGDDFVKAVQRAEDFVRKRKCLDMKVSAKNFFPGYENFEDEDNSEVDEGKFLDIMNSIDDIIECVIAGKTDEHVLNIYLENTENERHKGYYSTSENEREEIRLQPWFGPIESVDDQKPIFDYIFQLIKANKREGTEIQLDYVYRVCCPEAVIKSISLLKTVSMVEAEQLFINDYNYITSKNCFPPNDQYFTSSYRD